MSDDEPLQVVAIRELAMRCELEDAEAMLREALEARVHTPALIWVAVAEELGCVDLASRELDALRRARPHDPAIAEALAMLSSDLGDEADTMEVASSDAELPAIRFDEPAQDPGAVSDPLHEPADGDLVRFVHRFGGREDTHARQWHDPRAGGGYSPVRQALTPALLRSHLAGAATLGTYLVRLDGTVTTLVIDIDVTRRAIEAAETGRGPALEALRELAWEEALRLRGHLDALGLPVLLEDSGYKGWHLWVLLSEPVPAEIAYKLGRALLRAHPPARPEIHFESFPKQAEVELGGLGNLVKLPLGIHRRSGRRSVFVTPRGAVIPDPWPHLRSARLADRAGLLAALARLRDPPPGAGASPRDPGPSTTTFSQADPAETDAILAGCAVLSQLLTHASTDRRLSHAERIVLAHSLGHFAAGVDLVNGAFQWCPETPINERLQSVLRGNPISCARIR